MDCLADGIPRPQTKWTGGIIDQKLFNRFLIKNEGRTLVLDPIEVQSFNNNV